ncbi:hypothetical protein FH972_022633 [Carpinus fangiana]|uniref:Zn(2)-C6 fungal-type domain-containing protein n=1 Tax=Carpinus fangiana TaxID=176857 RepID=A0A5N6KT72_9ROSI|nr:hypothetical protein FH972_022633 [Carpinus fangiana]
MGNHAATGAQAMERCNASKNAPPSRLACTACRQKHWKCDGTRPCQRCVSNRLDCIFVQSQRGQRSSKKRMRRSRDEEMADGISPLGPRPCTIDFTHDFGLDATDSGLKASAADVSDLARPQTLSPSTEPLPTSNGITRRAALEASNKAPTGIQASQIVDLDPDLDFLSDLQLPTWDMLLSDGEGGSFALQSMEPAQNPTPDSSNSELDTISIARSGTDVDAGQRKLHEDIDAFYTFFHNAHPFLVPRQQIHLVLEEPLAEPLELAMHLIGCVYTNRHRATGLQALLQGKRIRKELPHNHFTVQALLLLALGSHGFGLAEEATETLDDAIGLALNLGMNTHNWAVDVSRGSRVLEESWRRTWWELYILDGMLAAVTQKTSFRTSRVTTDMRLPCEESEYGRADYLQSFTMAEYDDAGFASPTPGFSSYTYRIDAIRILAEVLPLAGKRHNDPQAFSLVDSLLANWRLHLPPTKSTPLTTDGQVDEMLFQATMINWGSTILLHQYNSMLPTTTQITTCAPALPHHPRTTPDSLAKVSAAAAHIDALIRLPCATTGHTHLFACTVVLASIVHLGVWSALAPNLAVERAAREGALLCTGALKGLAGVWPVAGLALRQVQGVARELSEAKKLLEEHRGVRLLRLGVQGGQ